MIRQLITVSFIIFGCCFFLSNVAIAQATSPSKALETEIQNLLHQEIDLIAGLETQRAEVDGKQALVLDREIATLKRSTEISILEAQHRFALAQGKTAMAESLDRSLMILRDQKAALAARKALHPTPAVDDSAEPVGNEGGAP